MVTVIKNGTIVTDTSEYRSDVKIEDGTITEIGSLEDIVGAEVVNASGSFLFPGFIDPHTHTDMGTGKRRTADTFKTGTAAAITGGTTTIIDFITQEKGGTLTEVLAQWHTKATGTSFCDYGFHMGIIDWNEHIRQEMNTMVQRGVTSFKMYMAYRNNLQVNDEIIYQALQQATKLGAIIGFHCENGDLIEARIAELLEQGKTGPYYHQIARAEETETEAIYRLGQIAKLAHSPIWVVHLSTAKGLEIINDLRREGVEVLAETCPQYLVLDNTVYGTPEDDSFEAAKFVMSPPPRDKSNWAPLWNGLREGQIQMVTSDHCPYHYKEQKEIGRNDFSQIPNGAPGVEHRIPLLYTYGVLEGRISRSDLVRVGATNPAKAFGLSKKGKIAVGMDADIVLFNPQGEHTIQAATQWQNVDYTPYEGMTLKGTIEQVFLRGKTVYRKDELAKTPTGEYLARTSYTQP